MSDVRKLLARLNPGAIDYGAVSGGGLPERTQADIAGALGMIRDDFDREVFCALWWPDGSRLKRGELDVQIRNKQLEEWMRRQRILVSARLAANIAEDEVEGTNGGVYTVKRELAHKRAEAQEAKANAWPSYQSRYKLIRAAVLTELASPRNCRLCGGRGHLRRDALVTACQTCNGTGKFVASEAQRADAIDVSRNVYQRQWGAVYRWTFDLCARADYRAGEEFANKLGLPPC